MRVLKRGRIQLPHHVRSLVVGEVSAAAADALLERFGAFGALEQFGVVVGFEDGARRARQCLLRGHRHHAHVRADEERRPTVINQVSHGIRRIVRHGERRHGEVADAERLGRLEDTPAILHTGDGRNGIRRVAVGVEDDVRVLLVEGLDARAMIASKKP